MIRKFVKFVNSWLKKRHYTEGYDDVFLFIFARNI